MFYILLFFTGICPQGIKRAIVESSNKIDRFKEELEIVSRECCDMLSYFKEKIAHLKQTNSQTEGNYMTCFITNILLITRHHNYHYKSFNVIPDVILKAAYSLGLATYKFQLEESIANFKTILSSSDLEGFLSDEEPDEEVVTDISDNEELEPDEKVVTDISDNEELFEV